MPKRLNTDPKRTKSSKLPASLFTTDALPAADRFAAWRESIGVILDARVGSPDAPLAFNARVESYLFDDVMLARSSFSAQKFDRSIVRIAQDSIDHYMIQYFLTGHLEMELGRRSLRAERPLVAFDLTEAMDSYDSDCDFLCIMIPRRRLAPMLVAPDALQGARVDPESGAGRLLTNYLITLFSVAPTLSPGEGSIAARTLLDLVALAFNGASFQNGDMPAVAQQAELLRVQGVIKERLSDAALDPDTVAQAAGMSRAQLYRLFAPAGGIAEYIREQRLRRCLADLLSVAQSHRQIADIAYSWGFADPTHFAKAFKQRFGRTPSEAREAISDQTRQDRAGQRGRIGDRLYEEWIAGIA
jgi:AraC-like DNA-binding protein